MAKHLEAFNRFKAITRIRIPFDGIMSMVKHKLVGDVMQLDKIFSQQDHDYDCDACTYKGVPMSMQGYILLKWGKEALYWAEEALDLQNKKEEQNGV